MSPIKRIHIALNTKFKVAVLSCIRNEECLPKKNSVLLPPEKIISIILCIVFSII